MSVKDKAAELAEAIKDTEEFQNLQSAENRISLDPKAQDLVDELQQKQNDLQQAQAQGQQPSSEVVQDLQQLQNQMKLNTTLQNLFKAQESFNELMQSVNQVITENLQDK